MLKLSDDFILSQYEQVAHRRFTFTYPSSAIKCRFVNSLKGIVDATLVAKQGEEKWDKKGLIEVSKYGFADS
jgi:hypothetical protein